MEFSLTEEQQLFRQTVRQFALEKLLPNYSRWDREERFDKSALKEFAALDVLGLRIPEQFGGQNLDFVTCGMLNERERRYCARNLWV